MFRNQIRKRPKSELVEQPMETPFHPIAEKALCHVPEGTDWNAIVSMMADALGVELVGVQV